MFTELVIFILKNSQEVKSLEYTVNFHYLRFYSDFIHMTLPFLKKVILIVKKYF